MAKTHGMHGTRFYYIYKGLKDRCTKKYAPAYARYGGRGIKCEWKSFESFYKDMYVSYLKHIKLKGVKDTTIDRVNNNGNYSKENCRWATYKEQMRNRRTNHLVTYGGQTKTVVEWAEILNLNEEQLRQRLLKGWEVKDAFLRKHRKRKEFILYHKNEDHVTAANRLGISLISMRWRLRNWSVEKAFSALKKG